APVAYKFPVTITAMAFPPDNKKLVVGGHHELTVWDHATGKLEKRIRTRTRRALAMLFLPDGKLVVAGGRPGQEGDVRVYNLAGNAKAADGVAILDGVNDKSILVKELLETDDSVYGVAVSPDGKKIASGGCDRIVRMWDANNGTMLKSLTGLTDWVYAVAISPDGSLVAGGSYKGEVRIWKTGDGALVKDFNASPGYVPAKVAAGK